MEYINNKSDFKLLVEIKINYVGIPFRFEFFTTFGGKTVVAEWNGTTYMNCRKVDNTHILVAFNDHGLSSGTLKVRKEFFIPDEDFEDHVNNSISIQDLGVAITTGASTEADPIKAVIAQTILKPIKGVDYFTYAEKSEWEDEIMAKIIGNTNFTNGVITGVKEVIEQPFYENLLSDLRVDIIETLKDIYKATLKAEVKAEIKSELKAQLIQEIKEELNLTDN